MFFGKHLEQLAPGYKAALTLSGEAAETEDRYSDPLDEQVWLWLMRFNEVLGAIRRTTEEELMGRDRQELTRQAITDMGSKLTEMLGVARPAPTPVSLSAAPRFTLDTVPTDTGEPDTMTDAANPVTPAEEPATPSVDMNALLTRIDALESSVAQQTARAEEAEQVAQRLSFERQVSDRVTKLRNWAQKLVRLGKVTPAALTEWFPEQEEHSDAIVRFSQPVEDGEPVGTEHLDGIEAALKYADKYVEPVKFGSSFGQVPLGDNPNLNLNDDGISEEEQSNINAVIKAAASKRHY